MALTNYLGEVYSSRSVKLEADSKNLQNIFYEYFNHSHHNFAIDTLRLYLHAQLNNGIYFLIKYFVLN